MSPPSHGVGKGRAVRAHLSADPVAAPLRHLGLPSHRTHPLPGTHIEHLFAHVGQRRHGGLGRQRGEELIHGVHDGVQLGRVHQPEVVALGRHQDVPARLLRALEEPHHLLPLEGAHILQLREAQPVPEVVVRVRDPVPLGMGRHGDGRRHEGGGFAASARHHGSVGRHPRSPSSPAPTPRARRSEEKVSPGHPQPRGRRRTGRGAAGPARRGSPARSGARIRVSGACVLQCVERGQVQCAESEVRRWGASPAPGSCEPSRPGPGGRCRPGR
jgi:hypothetical protein